MTDEYAHARTVAITSFRPGDELTIETLDVDSPPFVHPQLEEFMGQDPADPVWPSQPQDTAVGSVESATGHDPGTHGVRANHGSLDMLQHVAEETMDAMVERETSHGQGHHRPPENPRPLVITTYSRGSQSWRGVTFAVDGNLTQRIAEKRPGRTRLVITNQSAAAITIAADSIAAGTNFLTIPANTSPNNWREMFTEDEVFAFPAVKGTAQAVDVLEEYGIPE